METEAVKMDVGGDGADSEFEGVGGLVAGRRAKVEEGEAGVEVEQGDHPLGADVLAAKAGRVAGERRKQPGISVGSTRREGGMSGVSKRR